MASQPAQKWVISGRKSDVKAQIGAEVLSGAVLALESDRNV